MLGAYHSYTHTNIGKVCEWSVLTNIPRHFGEEIVIFVEPYLFYLHLIH